MSSTRLAQAMTVPSHPVQQENGLIQRSSSSGMRVMSYSVADRYPIPVNKADENGQEDSLGHHAWAVWERHFEPGHTHFRSGLVMPWQKIESDFPPRFRQWFDSGDVQHAEIPCTRTQAMEAVRLLEFPGIPPAPCLVAAPNSIHQGRACILCALGHTACDANDTERLLDVDFVPSSSAEEDVEEHHALSRRVKVERERKPKIPGSMKDIYRAETALLDVCNKYEEIVNNAPCGVEVVSSMKRVKVLLRSRQSFLKDRIIAAETQLLGSHVTSTQRCIDPSTFPAQANDNKTGQSQICSPEEIKKRDTLRIEAASQPLKITPSPRAGQGVHGSPSQTSHRVTFAEQVKEGSSSRTTTVKAVKEVEMEIDEDDLPLKSLVPSHPRPRPRPLVTSSPDSWPLNKVKLPGSHIEKVPGRNPTTVSPLLIKSKP